MPRPERPLDMGDPWMPFATDLRNLRRSANLTYRELAARTHYSAPALSMAASGHVAPAWNKVAAYLAACGVADPDQLSGWRRRYDETSEMSRRAAGPDQPEPATPETVTTWAQLAQGLDAVRRAAGLSYRQVGAGSGGRLSPSTISDLLSGRTQPEERTVRAFLAACQGEKAADADQWIAAWKRLRAGEVTPHQRRRPNESPNGMYASPSAVATQVVPSRRWQRLRELATQGRLAEVAGTAGPAERQEIFTAAYDLVWPIVFARLTRRVEQRRGHMACAQGVDHLADECLDRFHDDVEAVVNDLLTNARQPVQHLEAWVTGRLKAATVDGHRRRRGLRGALQRPRIPGWLAAELDHDRWLSTLATAILVWVGVPESAGSDVWPLEAWAQQRAAFNGDWTGSDTATVARDVETVLAAMRRRPEWYETYVERPLGHKQPPTSPGYAGDHSLPITLADPYDGVEAEMLRLAAAAVRAIDQRLSRTGGNAEEVVVDVLRTIFDGTMTTTSLDRAPHATADPVDGLSGALADTATVNRIVATVRDIISQRLPATREPDPLAT